MSPKDKPPDPSGQSSSVSRREFLRTAGVGSLATAVAAAPGIDAVEAAQAAQGESGPAMVGPGAGPVTLMVNGKRVDLRIEPRVTLLDAIRNHADLTGNKRVCDRGACGACTMIVDGRSIYSCSTLAIEVQGKQIRTVEGLSANGQLHPVQQAFCDVDALMCGFCTPGFVMATVALLESHPNATPEQMRKGLDGNICRCGTFVRVMEAAKVAQTAKNAKGGPRG